MQWVDSGVKFVKGTCMSYGLLLRSEMPPQHWLGVRGTPGIGKSMLGWYALWRSLHDMPTATVQYVKVGQGAHPTGVDVYTIPPAGGGAVTWSSNVRTLQPSAIVVWDSVRFPHDDDVANVQNILFVTSPNNRVYKNFKFKYPDSVHRFLPPWSPPEMDALRLWLRGASLGAIHLTESAVLERQAVVGGVPRLVFSRVSLVQLKDDVQEACRAQAAKSDIVTMQDVLRQDVGATDDGDDVHRVIHIVPQNSELGDPEFVLGSPFVAEQLVDCLTAKQGDVVSTFLRSSDPFFPLAVSRGIVFQGHALRKLELGGTFRVRPLLTGPAAAHQAVVTDWTLGRTCLCT